MNFKEIIKSIGNGIYQPIYFLNGENTYFIDKISDKILNSVLEESEKDFNETTNNLKNLKMTFLFYFLFYIVHSLNYTVPLKDCLLFFY